MARTRMPREEAEYALAYGERDDCTSDEARAEYDRLKAEYDRPRAGARPHAASPPKKDLSPVAGKVAAVLGSLVMAALALIAGIILQAVSGAKAGLCNTVIGEFAQQQSTGTAVNCGLWTGLDAIGQVLTWVGGIGVVALALLFGLAWLGKLK
jgi:hypothetical protein